MNIENWITRSFAPVALSFVLVGCGGGSSDPTNTPDGTKGETGPSGNGSLARTTPVAAGEECAAGGILVETGLDADANGELSFDEVAAGSSTVICNNDQPAAACGEAIEIVDVRGADQRFVLGQPAGFAVDLNVSTAVSLQVFGHGFDVGEGSDDEAFSLTPRTVGGPFDLAIVASDGCSVDVATITIEDVELNVARLRVAWFYSTWRNATIAARGSTDPLFEVDFLQVTEPVVFEPGTFEFDLIGQFGDLLTMLDTYTADPLVSTTLVTYPTANDELVQLYLEDDTSRLDQGVRLRALNVSPDVGTVDISIPDSTSIFSGLNVGLPTGAKVVNEQPLVLTLTRGTETWDYTFEGLFEPGTIANLFVYDDDGAPNVFVQFLDDDGSSVIGEPAELPNESFEDPSVTYGNLPPAFCEPAFPTWEPSSNDGSDGSRSMWSSAAYDRDVTNWFEMTFVIPVRGSVSFDTKTVGDAADRLGYCYEVGVAGCPPGNGNLATCDFDAAEETWNAAFDWATQTTPILDPGTYTIRWIHESGGVYHAPTSGQGYAYVDNIRFVAE